MAQEIKKQTIVDLDVYGRNSILGGALVHEDDFAISNSIIFYLTTSEGDYLFRPELGGVLESMLFKALTPEKASFYQSRIANALNNRFGALATDIEVSVQTDFENRLYRIDVFFTSVQSGQTNQVPIALKIPNIENLGKLYTPVDFVDDNLLGFVIVQKPNNSKPLIKNETDELWYWGPYKFTNFNEDSENFQEIFDIINN